MEATIEVTLSPEWVTALASLISAGAAAVGVVGILLAFRQLRSTKQIAQLQFEDGLAKEYRDLVARMPTKALLGESLSDEEYADAFDQLYRYFDLSNEQIYLRQTHRIGLGVWKEWASGMKANLALPTFARAWRDIQARSESFSEFRDLDAQGFATDPAEW